MDAQQWAERDGDDSDADYEKDADAEADADADADNDKDDADAKESDADDDNDDDTDCGHGDWMFNIELDWRSHCSVHIFNHQPTLEMIRIENWSRQIRNPFRNQCKLSKTNLGWNRSENLENWIVRIRNHEEWMVEMIFRLYVPNLCIVWFWS